MAVEVRFHKVLAAVGIVTVHALALYGLAAVSPPARAVLDTAPLTVHFVSQAEPRRERELPVVAMAPIRPALVMPAMPPIEIAVPDSLPDRSITLARKAVPPPAAHDDAPKLVSEVEYVREPIPRYPPQSRRMREEGLVVLRVLIDEQGRASSVDIESSSGHARLDHAAQEAVAAAVFRPYMEGGAPRRALVLIPIEFALKRSAA